MERLQCGSSHARPGVREQIVKEIRDIYDGNVIWGEDLMEIPIGTPRMAKME